MNKLEERSQHRKSRLRFLVISTFWRVLLLFKNDAEPLFHLGNIHYAYGHKASAMKYWKEAVSKNRAHEKAWHNLVQCAVIQEEWEQAAEGLTILCRNHPTRFEYTSLYTHALKKLGKKEELEEWYLSHINGPHHEWAIEELGMLYLRTRREIDAFKLLSPFVKEFPNRPVGLKILGISSIRTNQYEVGLTFLEKSLELKEDKEVKSLVDRVKRLKKVRGGNR